MDPYDGALQHVARTIQAKHFKTLFETLKELLTDTNIQFTPDGVRIIDLIITASS
jgi:hypothetical protein